MVIGKSRDFYLCPLERNDLRFTHELDNGAKIMHYRFEEPYKMFTGPSQFYGRHVYDQRERRFICENDADKIVGLVELMELNYIHRRGEFQIITVPGWQDHGCASTVTRLAIDYAFMALNLHKLYLMVDVMDERAVHVHEKYGFQREGELIEELLGSGAYHNALRMYVLRRDYVRSIRGTS